MRFTAIVLTVLLVFACSTTSATHLRQQNGTSNIADRAAGRQAPPSHQTGGENQGARTPTHEGGHQIGAHNGADAAPHHNQPNRDQEDCSRGGELRRHFECVAVRHTKHDDCCWLKHDQTHGKLPKECCGTGWSTHGCEEAVKAVCNTHPSDM